MTDKAAIVPHVLLAMNNAESKRDLVTGAQKREYVVQWLSTQCGYDADVVEDAVEFLVEASRYTIEFNNKTGCYTRVMRYFGL